MLYRMEVICDKMDVVYVINAALFGRGQSNASRRKEDRPAGSDGREDEQ
jgi:hypothetical protein